MAPTNRRYLCVWGRPSNKICKVKYAKGPVSVALSLTLEVSFTRRAIL